MKPRTLTELIAGKTDPAEIAAIAVRYQQRQEVAKQQEKRHRRLLERMQTKKLTHDAMTALVWEFSLANHEVLRQWLLTYKKDVFPAGGDGVRHQQG